MSPSTSSAQSSGSPSEIPSSPMPTLACMQPGPIFHHTDNGQRAASKMIDVPSFPLDSKGKPAKTNGFNVLQRHARVYLFFAVRCQALAPVI